MKMQLPWLETYGATVSAALSPLVASGVPKHETGGGSSPGSAHDIMRKEVRWVKTFLRLYLWSPSELHVETKETDSNADIWHKHQHQENDTVRFCVVQYSWYSVHPYITSSLRNCHPNTSWAQKFCLLQDYCYFKFSGSFLLSRPLNVLSVCGSPGPPVLL